MTPDFRALLADDAYAASFQSMGQYRTALLKTLATPPPREAEQALAALEADPKDGAMIMIDAEQFSIIHHALQRLKELEAMPNG